MRLLALAVKPVSLWLLWELSLGDFFNTFNVVRNTEQNTSFIGKMTKVNNVDLASDVALFSEKFINVRRC